MDERTGSDDDVNSLNLNRFIVAQAPVYNTVLSELKTGLKSTHWMWFIFPQIDGLGNSETTKYYSIKSLEEARQYLQHPVLGPRLRECAEAVVGFDGSSISKVFGSPDDMKLRSSMTLFASVANESVFIRVLDKYYNGERDTRTFQLLEQLKKTAKETEGP